MLAKRIIPVLTHDGRGNLLKPRSFARPARPVGSLMQTARVMAARDIDEILLIDILATEEKREPDFKKITEYCALFNVPVGVGGGIKTIEHVKQALDCGADKVILDGVTSVPNFMSDIANKFGEQAVTVNLCYHSLAVAGDMQMLARIYKEHGAGELILTNKTRDGAMVGYDVDVLSRVKAPYPIIINGGCSSPNDMHVALTYGADAVAASSLFLFTDETPASCAKYLKKMGHEVRAE